MVDQFTVLSLLVPLSYFILKSDSKVESFMLYFIATYIVTYVAAYMLNIRIDVSNSNDTNENNSIFISLIYLFYIGYFFQKVHRKNRIQSYHCPHIKGLEYIYDALIIVFLVAEFYLTDFSLLTGSNKYGAEVKDTYFFEYLNILFVFYLINKGSLNKKLMAYILVHSILAISDGNRLMAIGSLLIIFLQYVRYIPKKMIFPLVLFSFLFLELVGVMRSDLKFIDYGNNYLRDASFNSHQGSVIYSTLSIIDFGKTMDSLERIVMSSRYTLSLLLSQYWLPDNHNFVKAVSLHTHRPGGGMILGFFYAFFGYIGGFISGYLLSYSLSWGRYLDKNLSLPPYGLLLIILLPRYFAYTPMHIFKTVLLSFFLYIFLILLKQSSTK